MTTRTAQPPLVKVVHALVGRVRLRSDCLLGQHAACERIATALARAPEHERVTIRPATGSILIERAAGALDAAAIAARVLELVSRERDDVGRPLFYPPLPQEHPPTRLARAVARAVADVNEDVRAVLGQHADLGTILPTAFAAASIAEVFATGEMPGPTWFNLLWWSLRSFMTFNMEAVDGGIVEHPRLDLDDDADVTGEAFG